MINFNVKNFKFRSGALNKNTRPYPLFDITQYEEKEYSERVESFVDFILKKIGLNLLNVEVEMAKHIEPQSYSNSLVIPLYHYIKSNDGEKYSISAVEIPEGNRVEMVVTVVVRDKETDELICQRGTINVEIPEITRYSTNICNRDIRWNLTSKLSDQYLIDTLFPYLNKKRCDLELNLVLINKVKYAISTHFTGIMQFIRDIIPFKNQCFYNPSCIVDKEVVVLGYPEDENSVTISDEKNVEVLRFIVWAILRNVWKDEYFTEIKKFLRKEKDVDFSDTLVGVKSLIKYMKEYTTYERETLFDKHFHGNNFIPFCGSVDELNTWTEDRAISIEHDWLDGLLSTTYIKDRQMLGDLMEVIHIKNV